VGFPALFNINPRAEEDIFESDCYFMNPALFLNHTDSGGKALELFNAFNLYAFKHYLRALDFHYSASVKSK